MNEEPEIIVVMGDKFEETLKRLRELGRTCESISIGRSNAEYKLKLLPLREHQQTLPVSNDP